MATDTVPDLDVPALATLEAVQRRVLWLATSIVHHARTARSARRDRP